MSFRFQFRRGTAAERDAANPVLAAGEPAVVLDSGQPAELVLGDGVTAMADLRRAVWGDDARLALAGTAVQPAALAAAAALVPAFDALTVALTDATRPCAVQVLGDSTGDGTTDWPYRVAQSLAARYPGHSVVHRLWNDTTQDFDAPTVIQTGTAGVRYMDLTSGRFPRRLPTAAAPHLTGAIDVRVDLQAADWTPANSFGSTILVSEGGGAGNWGWYFSVNTAGYLQFVGSTNGTALDVIMTANATTGLVDGTRSWVRAVFNPNDGSGNRTAKFYKSTDGITWTQIGTTVTTAGTVVLSDRLAVGSIPAYLLGGVGAATNVTALKFYEVDIRNGADGPSIVPRLPDLWASYGAGTPHPFVGAPVLTFVNGSRSGASIDYLNDATRRLRLTPDYGAVVTLLSSSHNETTYIGRAWRARYAQWVTDVLARTGTGIAAMTQNPETSDATYSLEHARRRCELLSFGPALGIDVIDTWQDFLDAGWPGTLMADDVHPNATGSDVWRDVILLGMGFDS